MCGLQQPRGTGWAALALLAGLAACGLQPTASSPTPSPLPSSTTAPTSTPVWFPPTETPTPAPSITARPTEQEKPGVGVLTVTDTFEETSGWRTGALEAGRISLANHRITLAISEPQSSLASLRDGLLPADGYLEITASAALCQGEDAYGLLLRAASTYNGYRLLASCDGQLRMERLRTGETALLQGWTPSGELPHGGLLAVRFGIWSLGSELRIFVNDVYQFSVRDPVYTEGQLGVFARSAGDTPLTVSFSALNVYQLDTGGVPTATSLALPTP
jgi:hypothetical protein